MKKTLFIFLFIFCSSLVAQNPNAKGIALQYLQYPTSPLESNVKTYWVTVETNGVSAYQVPFEYGGLAAAMSLKEMAKISVQSTLGKAVQTKQRGLEIPELNRLGFKKSPAKNDADLQLKFIINSISSEGSVKKELNPVTRIETGFWNYTVESTMNFSTGIKDSKNNRVLILNENQVTSKVFTSESYASDKVAEKAFKDVRGVASKKLYDEMLQASFSSFRASLVNEFSYVKSQYNMAFVQGRGGKFDYSDLLSAFEEMKSINKTLKGVFKNKTKRYENFSDVSRIELNNKLDNCIKIWENAIQEYIPKTKKTRIGDKIIDHLYLNLSAAYFLKDNWSKASELLTKVSVRKSEIQKADKFNKLINRTSLARRKQ
jgi:hypothetical protein